MATFGTGPMRGPPGPAFSFTPQFPPPPAIPAMPAINPPPGGGGGTSGIAMTMIGAGLFRATFLVGVITGSIKAFFSIGEAGFSRMKSLITETVGAFRPFQVELFRRAIQDLQAVFGQMFLPVLRQAIVYIRQVADYFYSLPSSMKDVIVFVGKMVLVFGGLIAAIGVVVSLIATLAVVFSTISPIVAVLRAGIVALTVMFFRTAGGADLLAKSFRFVEEVIAVIGVTVQALWTFTAPLRSALADAFSRLGKALGNLLNSIKPAVFLLVVAAISLVVTGLEAMVVALTAVVEIIALLVNVATKLAPFLNLMRAIGPSVTPEVGRDTKNSFGLAARGGSISGDVAGMKVKMEEEVLRNTGRGAEDPNKKTADNTSTMVTLLQKLVDAKTSGKQQSDFATAGEAVGNQMAFGLGTLIFGK